MPSEFLVLECKAEGCVAEFYLNDVPVIRRGPELGKSFAGPIHQYLVDGVNELAVVIEPGETPSIAITGGEDAGRTRRTLQGASIWAKLARYPRGSATGGPDGVELLRVEWKSDAGGDARAWAFPRVVDGRVDLGPLKGRWAWQDAETLDLDEDEVGDLTFRLETLQESLENGDPEPFLALTGVRLDEFSRAYGNPPRDKIRQVRMAVQELSAEPAWGVEPVDPDRFDLRLCGRNRLVQCIAKDWDPILRAKPDAEGGQVTWELFFSRIGGEWKVTR